jgi:protein ImuA
MWNQNGLQMAEAASLEEFFVPPGSMGSLTRELLRRLGETKGVVLWVQDHLSRRESGQPCWSGVWQVTDCPVLYVRVGKPVDVLRVMEEGASCRDLAAVIGEIHGLPKALDFVATKRLKLRAEASGVPVMLVCSGPIGLSAARNRWRVTALPSASHPDDDAAPGPPRWQLDLTRARGWRPGCWIAVHDGAAGHVHLAPASDDGAMAPERRAAQGETLG